MPQFIDLTGERFGRLTVLKRDMSQKRTVWICKCDCGNTKSVQSTHLRSGATTSCGCYHKERASQANKTHGLTRSSLHNRWKAIRQRCNNPNDPRYKDYGGRGITLCPAWDDFEAFAKWAEENGYEPGMQLDRIDNNKGYSPDNCRWCTSAENNHNRRTTSLIDGIPLREFADLHHLDYQTVHYRYHRLRKSGQEITTESILAYANQLPLTGESR